MSVTMQYGRGTGRGSVPGFAMQLLWENSDPTASFAAQTVALDLSNYDMVYIMFGTTGGNTVADGYAEIGTGAERFYFQNAYSGSNMQYNQRRAIVTSAGVEFTAGSYRRQGSSGATTDNTVLIPLIIFGVRW